MFKLQLVGYTFFKKKQQTKISVYLKQSNFYSAVQIKITIATNNKDFGVKILWLCTSVTNTLTVIQYTEIISSQKPNTLRETTIAVHVWTAPPCLQTRPIQVDSNVKSAGLFGTEL